ncbi:TIR domain-containing protein [Streptomyces sp. NPDC003635]
MTGVETANLVIGIAGVLAAAAGVWFAYHEYRGRRSDAGRTTAPPQPLPAQGPYDALVAHAAGDADAADRLARRLHEAGLNVFLVRWVEPGLVPLLETERALTEAGWGVLVFGSGTMVDLRARDEYAALLHRKYEGGLRFVPARTTQDPLPPLAAIHQPLDLTRPGTDHYDREVSRLVRIIRAPRRAAGA